MSERLCIDDTEVLIDGQGEQVLVMVHGWPDTYRLWDRQVAHFASRYRCARFTLPGFNNRHPRRAYSLQQIVSLLKQVIEQVSPGRPVILLLHDWGCLFGYELAMQHPELVSGIIGVDVGDMQPKDASVPFKSTCILISYFSWLALAWRLGGRVGNAMTRLLVRVMRVPADPRTVDCRMNYPYYIAVTHAYGSYKNRIPFMPHCPTLYLYGRRKPLMFHSRTWMEALAQQPGCEIVEFDTYHWPMLEQPERFHTVIDRWLARAATHVAAASA